MTVALPPSPGQYHVDPKNMTLVDHLAELRTRLIVCMLAIALGTIGGWFLAPHALVLLVKPVHEFFHRGLAVDTVYGGFTLQLKIALVLGFTFALPVTMYEIWAFVAPAFGPKANRWAPIWILSAIVLFLSGALTGYLVFPLALRFFSGFQDNGLIQVIPFASQYIGFIVLILAVFGLSFELPLVLVSLTAAGITSAAWLASKRLYAFFGVFIFATIVTPGADWISPLILGGILYVLFEISILISRFMGK